VVQDMITLLRSLLVAAAVVWSGSAQASCNGQPQAGFMCGNPASSAAEPVNAPLTQFLDQNISAVPGTILYRGSSVWAGITPSNNSILVTNGSSVPSLGTVLPNGITATTQSSGDSSTLVATTAFVQSNIRTRMVANTTFYVNGDAGGSHTCGLSGLRVTCSPGSDSVTALQSQNNATPFLTLNTAILAVVAQMDWNGFRPTIAMADGNPGANYGGASCAFPIGTNGSMWIQGNDADNTTVTLTALNSGTGLFALYTTHYCIIRLRSVTVVDQGGGSAWGLEADNYGGVDIQNVAFAGSTWTVPMVRVGQTGHLELVSPLNTDDVFVKSSGTSFLRVDTGGNANFGSSAGSGFTAFFTINIAPGLTFSNGFFNVPSGATLFNMTSGTLTGNSFTGVGAILNGPGFLQTNANVPCATIFSKSSGGCQITNGFQTDAADPVIYAARTKFAVGTLPDQTMAFSVTATFPTSPTVAQNAILFDITGAGTANQITRAFRVIYEPGYTGAAQTNAFSVVNNSQSTASTLIFTAGGNSVLGNLGNSGTAVGITAGLNAGGAYFAANGSINAGIIGMAQVATNSAINLGVVGSAINTGTSGLQVGGYFSINQTANLTVSAALIADNGPGTSCSSAACPIALFRVNAVTQVSVGATGGFVVGNTNTDQGAGTMNGTSYYAAGIAGIDCLSGVTAGSVVVHKGIVTHC
jgi:hypothetical protein